MSSYDNGYYYGALPSSPPPARPFSPPPLSSSSSSPSYDEDPYGIAPPVSVAAAPPPPQLKPSPRKIPKPQPSSSPPPLPLYSSPPPPSPTPSPSPPPPAPVLSPPPPLQQAAPPILPFSYPSPPPPPVIQNQPPPSTTPPANYSPPSPVLPSPPLPTPPAPVPAPQRKPPITPPPPPKKTKPRGSKAPPTPKVAETHHSHPHHSPSSSLQVVPNPSSSGFVGGKGAETVTIASAAIVAGVVVLSLLGVLVWSVKKSRRPVVGYPIGNPLPSNHGSSMTSVTSETSYTRSPGNPFLRHGSRTFNVLSSLSEGSYGVAQLWFTYEELSEVTNGFSSQNLLGEGGFGSVYKGSLPDGREVAVKKLKDGGIQGEREFKAEVEIISRVHHRHLVSLVGYCISENHRLLVFDYVPNNTLYYHLHGGRRPVMDWATRIKVAAGAARGIAYLHEDCHPRIIHRDIKSSNILLDNNLEAQVSDFGLARLTMDAGTHVTTRVMGTFGYLAPEYASSGKLTTKSDIYSFGVVLLELITGRRPVDMSQPLGDESLVEWARPLLLNALETGSIEGIPDPMLENKYKRSEMLCLIEAAASCVRHSAAMRPRMSQVVRALDGLCELDLQNGVRLGQSAIFDSAQHSIEIGRFQSSRNDASEDVSYQGPIGWRTPRYYL